MRLVQFEEFLSRSKDFVGDAKNIVVATYGKIIGYPDGLTARNTEDGRQVKVVVGGGMFNGVNFGFFRIPDPDPFHVQATKDAGVNTISGELSEVPESTFIILYAGTSRLGKMIDLGASLAEKGAKVALLSCGCDRPVKFSRVDEVPGKDNITVVMPHHPGYCDSEAGDLAEIADIFLKQ